MKVPPKRKGNFRPLNALAPAFGGPSMKVPPKRKGNLIGSEVRVTQDVPQ